MSDQSLEFLTPVITHDGRRGQVVAESEASYTVLLSGGFQEDFAKDQVKPNNALMLAWEAVEALVKVLQKYCGEERAGAIEADALRFAAREALLQFNSEIEEGDRHVED